MLRKMKVILAAKRLTKVSELFYFFLKLYVFKFFKGIVLERTTSSDQPLWSGICVKYFLLFPQKKPVIRENCDKLMPYPCSHFYFDINFNIRYYIQKRRGQALLFSFEYNLLPNLISNFNHYMDSRYHLRIF